MNKSQQDISTSHTSEAKGPSEVSFVIGFSWFVGSTPVKISNTPNLITSFAFFIPTMECQTNRGVTLEKQVKPRTWHHGPDNQNSDQTHALVMSWRLKQVTTAAGDSALVSFNIHQLKVRNSKFLLPTSCKETTIAQQAAPITKTHLLLLWLQLLQCAIWQEFERKKQQQNDCRYRQPSQRLDKSCKPSGVTWAAGKQQHSAAETHQLDQ